MKEVITVDFDDVMVPSGPLIVRLYNRMFNARVQEDKLYSLRPEDWEVDHSDIGIKRVHSIYDTEEYQSLRPSQEVVDLFTLLSRYYDQHVVTGRPGFVRHATEMALDAFPDGVFQSVTFTNHTHVTGDTTFRRKSEIVAQYGARWHIDDHIEHAVDVAMNTDAGALLVPDQPWNRLASPLPPNIVRIPRLQGLLPQLLEQEAA